MQNIAAQETKYMNSRKNVSRIYFNCVYKV